MRDEVLDGEEFANVLEARVVLAAWIEELQFATAPPRTRHEDSPTVRRRRQARQRMRGTSLNRTGPVHRRLPSLVRPRQGASARSSTARHSHRNWTRSRGLVNRLEAEPTRA